MRGVCILMSWVTQGHLLYLEYLEYLLLVLLARDARHDALDHGRRHCPHEAVRDRGRLPSFIALGTTGAILLPRTRLARPRASPVQTHMGSQIRIDANKSRNVCYSVNMVRFAYIYLYISREE